MAATDSQTAAVENEIAHLRGLDLDGLRARWRSQTGRAAPAHLPKDAAAAGARLSGPGSRVRRPRQGHRASARPDRRRGALREAGRSARPGPGRDQARDPAGAGVGGHFPARDGAWPRALPGTASTYPSLSKVARAITGTRWNGPRFFGLRDQKGRAG